MCIGLLKIVYFIGNLDKYYGTITDTETGLKIDNYKMADN